MDLIKKALEKTSQYLRSWRNDQLQREGVRARRSHSEDLRASFNSQSKLKVSPLKAPPRSFRWF